MHKALLVVTKHVCTKHMCMCLTKMPSCAKSCTKFVTADSFKRSAGE
jgi:hypothetical protein